jgi:ADP-ribosylglycohydrolase
MTDSTFGVRLNGRRLEEAIVTSVMAVPSLEAVLLCFVL